MKTSGPAGPSRSTTTVAAGRAFATITADILVDDALVLRHGSERPDRGTAARLRGDSNVEAAHVGLQTRRLGDSRARRTDRVAPRARRDAAENPEHRPLVDADHP